MKTRVRSALHRGFSLVELLVVIMIIAILMGLVVVGSQYAMSKSYENKTRMQMKAIETALEKYFTERLEYPNPSNAGSGVLYMSLTGDGITGVNATTGRPTYGSPDGKLADAEQARWPVYLEELVPSGSKAKGAQGWLNINPNTGIFVDPANPIIDGFGEPLQYVCRAQGNNPPAGIRNTTYDLWSYGTDTTKNPNESDPKKLSKWITNWN
jgi:prepilin-type N-terminal cleavage/methylation domain-containing protein